MATCFCTQQLRVTYANKRDGMKWFKRIVGILLSLQSISFVSHVINDVNLYLLDGNSHALGRSIFMSSIGLAFLVSGIMLFRSTLKKKKLL